MFQNHGKDLEQLKDEEIELTSYIVNIILQHLSYLLYKKSHKPISMAHILNDFKFYNFMYLTL